MRLALRALLIATGLAVMVATSPVRGPFTLDLFLPTGGAQTVEFFVRSNDGKQPVKPLLHVLAPARHGATAGARIVGIVSPTRPPSDEAYHQLDPKASFTVGQQLEGLGTIAFVQQLPSPSDPGNMEKGPLPLPEHENIFLTVYSPDTELEVSLNLAVAQMQEECHCTVAETYPSIVHYYHWPERPPGGTDGGGH